MQTNYFGKHISRKPVALLWDIITTMTGKSLEPTHTNDNNTPKVETVDEHDAKEDENENEETIQDEEGLSSK